MVLDISSLKSVISDLKNFPFKYVLPISAGRNSENELGTVSDLLIKDAHNFLVNGYAEKIILLGSQWDSFKLKNKFNLTGAELRKVYLKRLNENYLSNNPNGRRISDEDIIAVPRGLETINKFIALRKILKDHRDSPETRIAILAPDEAFGKRIDLNTGVFLDFGKLGKHTVFIMHHEKELDDENRVSREVKMLEATKRFFETNNWIDNSSLKDDLMNTVEEDLVRTKQYQLFFEDCAKILEEYPVTGNESPYKGLDSKPTPQLKKEEIVQQ